MAPQHLLQAFSAGLSITEDTYLGSVSVSEADSPVVAANDIAVDSIARKRIRKENVNHARTFPRDCNQKFKIDARSLFCHGRDLENENSKNS
ncbi:hypothetical protein ABI_02780 [Asticcacaulis biprosthecium C19]|uniref:Uncharacterized protein n=1 Tax=Asticcacaulis biprosthecium C19 TaxID=715226 RepID=F4QIT7_9CAUL|nr:hypothetical protein ABI_02780 [Asticcacaulis biprosthecium C19]